MQADFDHLDHIGSKPAPGRLALVQAFVNTVDLESGRDAWTSPGTLAGWLEHYELLPDGTPLTEEDLSRAVALREGFRALLLVNNGAPLDARVTQAVHDLATDCLLRVALSRDGTTSLEPVGSGLVAAHARLLAIAHDAMVDGTWPRLKSCRSDTCHWAFYDHSKNRSGTWCSMAVCGSREKSRAYRQRSQDKEATT